MIRELKFAFLEKDRPLHKSVLRKSEILRRLRLLKDDKISFFECHSERSEDVVFHLSSRARHGYSLGYTKVNQAGFTIIEILVAIVVIGITVPAIMIPFSGLEDTKNPEYIIQGSFIGQKKMEDLASRFRLSSDTNKDITTVCPGSPAALPPEGDYSLTCSTVDVNATDPDSTATSTFAKKIILTVSRSGMSDLTFNTLLALND